MKRTKFFGVPLEKIVEEENKLVPTVFKELIRSLNNETHLKSDGLFRKTPNALVINEWKAKIDGGVAIDYKQLDKDITFGLMKTWLKELPTPLSTFELYEEFVAVSDTMLHGPKIANLIRYVIDNYSKLFKAKDFTTVRRNSAPASPAKPPVNISRLLNIKMTVSQVIEDLHQRLDEEKNKLLKCETPEETADVVKVIHAMKTVLEKR